MKHITMKDFVPKGAFRKALASLCLILAATLGVLAQSPNAIPYQGVARDAAGNIMATQNISLRISIHDVTATGTVVFNETHNVTTTNLGLFNVNIGQGTPVTGTLAGVDWGTGAKFVQVEMDPAGGTSYTDMGTTQLMSVPYALFAGSSGNLPAGTANGNTLRWDGTQWVADNALHNNGTNVGIGTATPSTNLHVAGTVSGVRVEDTDDGSSIYLYAPGTGYTGGVGTGTNHDLPLFTNNVDRMTIKADGDIGIGTASPLAKTHIQSPGSGLFMGGYPALMMLHAPTEIPFSLVFRNDVAGVNGDFGLWQSNNGDLQFSNGPSNVFTNLYTFGANGNMGIGTTLPSEKLDVAGKTKTTEFQMTNGAAAGTVLTGDGAGNATWAPASSLAVPEVDPEVSSAINNQVPKWNGTTLVDGIMTDNGNNVGIGTTSPTRKLHISAAVADIRVDDNDDNSSIWLSAPGNGYSGGVGTTSNHDLAMFANGVDHMTIKANGNVGIGTTDPTYPGTSQWAKMTLAAEGTQFTDFIHRYADDSNFIPAYVFARSGGALASPTIATNNMSLGGMAASGYNGTEFSLSSWILFQTDGAPSATDMPGRITFATRATGGGISERMRIDNAGNVGIGTAAPSEKLDVAGKTKTTEFQMTNGAAAGTVLTGDGAGNATWASAASFADNLGDHTYTQMITTALTSGPMIRIGNDATIDDVNDGNYIGIAGLQSAGASGGIRFGGTPYPNNPRLFGNSTGLDFITNGTSKMFLTSTGNLGIGTTPAGNAKLHVTGRTILSEGPDFASGNVQIGTTINANNAKLYVENDQDFGVYINSPTAAQFALYVNGEAAKPGGSAWIVASDSRLKNNVLNYNDGLATLMKINPVKFHYTEKSGYNSSKEYVGVIAQDLQKVAPYMVGQFKDIDSDEEYLNVDNTAMTYMLINAVKEQQQQIEKLKAEIEILKQSSK